MNKLKSKKIILVVSIVLFILSLTQKSYGTLTDSDNSLGLLTFLIGWLGVISLHLPAMIWLANPILLMSWVFIKKKEKQSFILSIFSLFIMLSFLLVDKIMDNESGATSKITSYGLGYWLWVLSSFTMVIGNVILFEKKRRISKIVFKLLSFFKSQVPKIDLFRILEDNSNSQLF